METTNKSDRKPPASAQPDARWLGLREAGLYLGGISAEAVRMMLRRGRLPYAQIGRRIYIDRRDIDSMMEAVKVTPAA